MQFQLSPADDFITFIDAGQNGNLVAAHGTHRYESLARDRLALFILSNQKDRVAIGL